MNYTKKDKWQDFLVFKVEELKGYLP